MIKGESPDKIKRLLLHEEELFNKFLSDLGNPEYVEEMAVMVLAGLAENIGLCYISLGNYDIARESFLKSFEFEEKYATLEEKKPNHNPQAAWSSFYATMFSCLKISILTLDQNVMKKAAKRFDLSTPVNKWSRPTRPFYAVIKALSSMILNEKEELKKIKEQSQDMRRRADTDGILSAIWAISGEDLDELRIAFKKIVASESHNGKAKFSGVSAIATILLILAQMKVMNLEDFDPLYVDMNYVKLAQSL